MHRKLFPSEVHAGTHVHALAMIFTKLVCTGSFLQACCRGRCNNVLYLVVAAWPAQSPQDRTSIQAGPRRHLQHSRCSRSYTQPSTGPCDVQLSHLHVTLQIECVQAGQIDLFVSLPSVDAGNKPRVDLINLDPTSLLFSGLCLAHSQQPCPAILTVISPLCTVA